MCATVCGRFVPDEGAVAGYGNRIRDKGPAKWDVQIVGMIFQTGSSIQPSQPFFSGSLPKAGLLFLSSRLRICRICRKDGLRSPETEGLWILHLSQLPVCGGFPDSPASDMDEAYSR